MSPVKAHRANTAFRRRVLVPVIKEAFANLDSDKGITITDIYKYAKEKVDCERGRLKTGLLQALTTGLDSGLFIKQDRYRYALKRRRATDEVVELCGTCGGKIKRRRRRRSCRSRRRVSRRRGCVRKRSRRRSCRRRSKRRSCRRRSRRRSCRSRSRRKSCRRRSRRRSCRRRSRRRSCRRRSRRRSCRRRSRRRSCRRSCRRSRRPRRACRSRRPRRTCIKRCAPSSPERPEDKTNSQNASNKK